MIYNQKVIVSESKSPSQLFKNQKIINRAR